MSWGNPSALWWLAAIPVVVLLYWLRPRRVPVVVSSVLLWRRALRERVRSRPLRRFEGNVLLLIQVLAVLAASLGLARPQRPVRGEGDVVAVVDLGVTLQATDVRPSRFEAARAAAAELLRSAKARRVAVVAAAWAPRLVQPLTAERGDALRALHGLRPTDGPSDLEAAVALARSLSPSAEVHAFSDRPAAHARSQVFGGPLEDVAITGVVASPTTPGRMRVTVRVHNRTSGPRQVPVSVLVDGRPAARVPVALQPGQEAAASAEVAAGLLVEARIRPQDSLAATDRYPALGTHFPRPRVLVTGPPEPFLERAVEVVAGPVRRQAVPDPQVWGEFSVVVLHRVSGVALPPGNYLLVDSLPSNLPLHAGSVRSDTVAWQSRTHPLTRFVDLSGVRVDRARAVEVAGGEVVLQGDLPLAWAYEGEGLRAVLLAFSPSQSDVGLRPGFPIFVANTLQWLAGPLASALEAGASTSVPSAGTREGVLRGPEGTVRLRPQGGRFFLPPFDRAGFYTLEAGPVRRVWAVYPSARSQGAVSSPPASGVPEAARRDLGGWLVGAFLALLVAEWWVFCRRQA
jgi:Ca-activated chloride channel family protein